MKGMKEKEGQEERAKEYNYLIKMNWFDWGWWKGKYGWQVKTSWNKKKKKKKGRCERKRKPRRELKNSTRR